MVKTKFLGQAANEGRALEKIEVMKYSHMARFNEVRPEEDNS